MIHQYPSQLIQMLTLTLRWSHLLIDIFGHSYGKRWFQSHDSRSGDKPDHISEKWWDFWDGEWSNKNIRQTSTGWWFGSFFIFPFIGNVIIPTDEYFSEGLKPPTSQWWHCLKQEFSEYPWTEETKGIPSAVLLQVKNKAHKRRRPKQLLLYWSHVGNSQAYDDFWHHMWRFPQYS